MCPSVHVWLQVELPVLLEPSWAVLEFELASALHGVIKKYWYSQQVRRKTIFRPRSQVRLAWRFQNSCNTHLSDEMWYATQQRVS